MNISRQVGCTNNHKKFRFFREQNDSTFACAVRACPQNADNQISCGTAITSAIFIIYVYISLEGNISIITHECRVKGEF